MKYNTFYEDQCCTSCFKSEGTKITECPSYHMCHALMVEIFISLVILPYVVMLNIRLFYDLSLWKCSFTHIILQMYDSTIINI